MICRLRRSIFAAIIQQEISFFDESRTGELTNRLSSDAQVVQTLVTGNIGTLIQNSIHVVGSLLVLFYLEVTLTLVLIATVPVVVLIAMKYGQVVKNLRTAFQDDLAKTGAIAEESFSNIRMNVFFREDHRSRSRLRDDSRHCSNLWRRTQNDGALSTEPGEIFCHGQEISLE